MVPGKLSLILDLSNTHAQGTKVDSWPWWNTLCSRLGDFLDDGYGLPFSLQRELEWYIDV